MSEPSEAARKLAKEVWRLAISSGPLFERQSLAETDAQSAFDAAAAEVIERAAQMLYNRGLSSAADEIRALAAPKQAEQPEPHDRPGLFCWCGAVHVLQAGQPDTVYRNILDTERALEVRAEQADHEFVPAAVPLCAECGKPRFMHNLPKSAHRRSEEKR